ncbi:hypothetical protein IG631_13664 [Alternaria alternata]|nr:hypothetical protein IG631_13664 [Alternaria alternata]
MDSIPRYSIGLMRSKSRPRMGLQYLMFVLAHQVHLPQPVGCTSSNTTKSFVTPDLAGLPIIPNKHGWVVLLGASPWIVTICSDVLISLSQVPDP